MMAISMFLLMRVALVLIKRASISETKYHFFNRNLEHDSKHHLNNESGDGVTPHELTNWLLGNPLEEIQMTLDTAPVGALFHG